MTSYEVTNLTETGRQYEQIIMAALLLGWFGAHLIVRGLMWRPRERTRGSLRRPLVAVVAAVSGLAVASCGTPGGVEEAPATIETAEPPAEGIAGTGEYRVGAEIDPGRYVTAGANGDGLCSWMRMHADTGRADTVIGSGVTRSRATITIEPSDGVFRTEGCQPWERTPRSS